MTDGEPRAAILRSSRGLGQLYECPVCGYFVHVSDIIWIDSPRINPWYAGEICSCTFCLHSPAMADPAAKVAMGEQQ